MFGVDFGLDRTELLLEKLSWKYGCDELIK
jgi:hypothetical protein